MSALEEEYLTVDEAATLLHVAPSTVRRWIREGELPAYRMGKRRLALRRTDVRAMITPIRPDVANDPREAVRPLTLEDVQRAREALEEAQRINERLLRQRNGQPFESSVDIIRAMREERLRQLG